jgi:protein ImuA
MPDSSVALTRLKRRIERLGRARAGEAMAMVALGAAGLDARLGGGLARGALHELCGAGENDLWAASGFALMLALRAAGDRSILWIREDKGVRAHGGIYAPGLAELGGDPARVVLVHACDTLAALRAGADSLGAKGLGAVVIEPFGAARPLDLTASRKLVLAAERSGAAAFILRDRDGRFASAAATRWSVAAAPSAPLPGQAPGYPVLRIALVRHRGGVAPFETLVEWNRDRQLFREPAPLLRHSPAAAERGQMAA